MKVVIQRVKEASVKVENEIVSKIGKGFLVLVGLHADDTPEKFDPVIKKIVNLRVFPDDQDKMNLSLLDTNYEILLVSQFTLYADCEKGNRPSFVQAMGPEEAKGLYGQFVDQFKKKYSPERVKDGVFGAMMDVSLVNDGPVTIILEL